MHRFGRLPGLTDEDRDPAPGLHHLKSTLIGKIIAKIDGQRCRWICVLQVGDSLKIGQLGGKLGSAIIDDMTPTAIQLREVQLTLAPPNKLDLTVVLALPRPKGAWSTKICVLC